MVKIKKGFGDDLIGAYTTRQTEGTEPTESELSNVDIKDNNYRIDNKHDMTNNHLIDNKYNINDAPKQKKRGRPKVTDRETRSKNFNLLMKPSTFKELNRIAGQKQAKTGEKVSVTDLVNTILEDYIARHKTMTKG